MRDRITLKEWLKFPFMMLWFAFMVIVWIPVIFCRFVSQEVDRFFMEINSDR